MGHYQMVYCLYHEVQEKEKKKWFRKRFGQNNDLVVGVGWGVQDIKAHSSRVEEKSFTFTITFKLKVKDKNLYRARKR